MTLLFAAILGINRLFVAEREQAGFDGILMAPIERTSLLLAKARRAARLPGRAGGDRAAGVRALLHRLRASGPRCRGSPLVTLLADVGLAVVGAMLASIAVHTRARDLLLPLLLLPLTVPAVIAAAAATEAAALGAPRHRRSRQMAGGSGPL